MDYFSTCMDLSFHCWVAHLFSNKMKNLQCCTYTRTSVHVLYHLNLRSTNSIHQISVISLIHTLAQSATSQSEAHIRHTFSVPVCVLDIQSPSHCLIMNTSQVQWLCLTLHWRKNKKRGKAWKWLESRQPWQPFIYEWRHAVLNKCLYTFFCTSWSVRMVDELCLKTSGCDEIPFV